MDNINIQNIKDSLDNLSRKGQSVILLEKENDGIITNYKFSENKLRIDLNMIHDVDELNQVYDRSENFDVVHIGSFERGYQNGKHHVVSSIMENLDKIKSRIILIEVRKDLVNHYYNISPDFIYLLDREDIRQRLILMKDNY